MTELFVSILNLTIAGSGAAVIVLFLRLFLKRFSRIYSYILWILVFFRFISPFSVETALRLFPVNRISVEPDIVYEMFPAVNTGIGAVDRTVNSVLVTALAGSPETSLNPMQAVLGVCAFLWAAGAVIIGGVQLLRLIRFSAGIRTGVPLDGETGVKLSEWAEVPVVAGLFRPSVVLPYGISQQDQRYILAHERIHIVRRDYLVKAVCFLIAVVHWFNPLVWLSYGKLCLDMEISCDERAVRGMELAERKEYSMALLRFAGRRSGLWISPAFGESHTRQRVKQVLSVRHGSVRATAAAVCCTVLAGCGLVTSPEPDGVSRAASIIGGADGPTSIFLAGKTDGKEIPIAYGEAAWNEGSAAENLWLDQANPNLPEKGCLAVFHGPQGVFVFRGTGEDLELAASVDMAGVDSLYGEMYSRTGGDGPVFEVLGNGGNGMILGFSENGEWMEDHMYLLYLDTEELCRLNHGAELADAWKGLTAGPSGQAPGKGRLMSETGLFQDLFLEMSDGENTVRYALFSR